MTNNSIEIMQECFNCKHAIIWHSHRYVTCKKMVRIKPKEIFKGAVGMYLMPVLFDPIWKSEKCSCFREGENKVIKRFDDIRTLKMPWKWREFIIRNVYLDGSFSPKDQPKKRKIRYYVNSMEEIERIAKELGIKRKQYKMKHGKNKGFDKKSKIEMLKNTYLFKQRGCSYTLIGRFLGLKSNSVILSWVRLYDFDLPKEEVFKEIEKFEDIIDKNGSKLTNNRGILFYNVTGQEWRKNNIPDKYLKKFAEFIYGVIEDIENGINVRRKYIKDKGIYMSDITVRRLMTAFGNKTVEEIINKLKEANWTC